jgi:hypothetical protein
MHKVGRNDSCPCGSGKKFKKCCEEKIARKKFDATVISSGTQNQILDKAAKIGTSFFQKKPLETIPEHKEPLPPENEL